ncbi:MAG: hypothetical protein JWO60_2872, partial [Frankiales bacterium]|nr:hypothetical protein [Frankiales bacterium]
MSNWSGMSRLRSALVAAALLCAGLPAIASAAPADCLEESDVDLVLCAAVEAGRTAGQVTPTLVGPRDTVGGA